MFKKIKKNVELAKIAFVLGLVTQKYPSFSFHYAKYNKDHTTFYTFDGEKLYQKDASDVALLEARPAVIWPFNGIYLIRKDSFTTI
jgi:hypothetical protein